MESTTKQSTKCLSQSEEFRRETICSVYVLSPVVPSFHLVEVVGTAMVHYEHCEMVRHDKRPSVFARLIIEKRGYKFNKNHLLS